MFYADTSKFGRHPNYASIREKYEATTPWRNSTERPAGSRRQRWAKLIKTNDTYVVTAWGTPILTYRPDGFIDVHLASQNISAHRVINRMVPWVMPWGCSTSWLMINTQTLGHYPYYTTMFGNGDPAVVALNTKTRTVSLREFVPNGPPLATTTMFEHAARDLVAISMLAANRPARTTIYAEYGLPAFATWLRAYLQMVAPAGSGPSTRWTGGHYQTRWSLRYANPNAPDRMDLLRDPAHWVTLAGPTDEAFDPARRTTLLIEMLREDLQRELGVHGVQVTPYQALPFREARIAHQQHTRFRSIVGWRNLHDVPYADATPFVATATNPDTTTSSEATT
jgi:hypothetical protein